MTPGARGRLGAVVIALAVAAACGKRGNPLPPLRSVPARIADLTAHRVDDRVELSWTVSAANTDGTATAVTAVEIYAVSTPAAAEPPAPAALIVKERLAARLAVGRAASPAAAKAPAAEPRPAPGDRARFVERVPDPLPADAAVRHYVVVPVTGQTRARPEARSDVVSVPLPAAALPAAPRDVSVTFTETALTVRWQPAADGQSFRVLAAAAQFDPASATALTPSPVSTPSFSTPVEFGRERCVAVRAVAVTGPITVEGPATTPVCVTPVDKFPPPSPSNLQAIQEGASVTLVWTGVEAPDLAGYVVLRGDGAGENMQPLAGGPVSGTTYRDSTVQPGATYVYAVHAQDRAVPPNISQLSNRQQVTMR